MCCVLLCHCCISGCCGQACTPIRLSASSIVIQLSSHLVSTPLGPCTFTWLRSEVRTSHPMHLELRRPCSRL
ncbi:uncharacterized protein LAESUDRAFT_516237 [Laetiporus sulphureus 93-53]|uniref:Secreted protein n=1 Tax=Laetiporus sulphureus 93-53 TaxID=1314785 RepID=A0A165G0V7_9APHY|nr:uncharacterized protein LAESUDRAFT_516237 [Laetiporus sulphureus 93-53]KZT09680.1 hypothetical protein LAESUDRAFT_516237 [Laetiporus sulphureus 93-53]